MTSTIALDMKLSRKEFLQAAAKIVGGLTAAGAAGISRSANAQPAAIAGNGTDRTHISNVDVLTMDPKLGELVGADVVLEDEKIVELSDTRLKVSDANHIDGTDMILMPGMYDGHRHNWQSLIRGALVKSTPNYRDNYFGNVVLRYPVCFEPDDAYFANYLAGLGALDSGVTSVVDHCHISQHDVSVAEAAIQGSLDSGVGGYFCYKLGGALRYRPGDSITTAEAFAQLAQEPQTADFDTASALRDKYFSNSDSTLQFGLALMPMGGVRKTTFEAITDEFKAARAMSPALITQHLRGYAGPSQIAEPRLYRHVRFLYESELLGPDFLISHGNELSSEEIQMLKDQGGAVTSSVTGEFVYDLPSVHGRAYAAGVPACLATDVDVAITRDYFEHLRNSFWGLFKDKNDVSLARTLSSTDVLKFATTEGARAFGMDTKSGSVSPGKMADLVLLKTNRFGFPTGRIPSVDGLADRVLHFASTQDIDSVWVRGKLKKHSGKLIEFDWSSARKELIDRQEKLVAKAQSIDLVGAIGLPDR